MLYETLLLAALLFVATALFMALAGPQRTAELRTALQIYLVAFAAGYFVWSWTGGRRTLAMRTWRLRLVDRNDRPPELAAALLRFVVAAATLPLGLLALWWALLDRDRIAGTRLVREADRRAIPGRDGSPR